MGVRYYLNSAYGDQYMCQENIYILKLTILLHKFEGLPPICFVSNRVETIHILPHTQYKHWAQCLDRIFNAPPEKSLCRFVVCGSNFSLPMVGTSASPANIVKLQEHSLSKLYCNGSVVSFTSLWKSNVAAPGDSSAQKSILVNIRLAIALSMAFVFDSLVSVSPTLNMKTKFLTNCQHYTRDDTNTKLMDNTIQMRILIKATKKKRKKKNR